MDLTTHSTNNFTYAAPKGTEEWCQDAHVTKGAIEGREVIATYWQPNDAELQILMQGGSVVVMIHADHMHIMQVATAMKEDSKSTGELQ